MRLPRPHCRRVSKEAVGPLPFLPCGCLRVSRTMLHISSFVTDRFFRYLRYRLLKVDPAVCACAHAHRRRCRRRRQARLTVISVVAFLSRSTLSFWLLVLASVLLALLDCVALCLVLCLRFWTIRLRRHGRRRRLRPVVDHDTCSNKRFSFRLIRAVTTRCCHCVFPIFSCPTSSTLSGSKCGIIYSTSKSICCLRRRRWSSSPFSTCVVLNKHSFACRHRRRRSCARLDARLNAT